MLGIVGFVATVGAYGFYSQGLPDPKTAFDNLDFDEQTIVYDRTGKIELARFGQIQRQVIDVFAQLSPVLVDATTSVEDKTFWSNAGFDPVGIVSAAVDDRVAATAAAPRRSPSSSSGPGSCPRARSSAPRTTARSARSSSRSA